MEGWGVLPGEKCVLVGGGPWGLRFMRESDLLSGFMLPTGGDRGATHVI